MDINKLNTIIGGPGKDYQAGSNEPGITNVFNGKGGNDVQVGGGAGTTNIFNPGRGTNLITTEAGSVNKINLSKGGSQFGNNYIDASAGKSTIDLTNYKGYKGFDNKKPTLIVNKDGELEFRKPESGDKKTIITVNEDDVIEYKKGVGPSGEKTGIKAIQDKVAIHGNPQWRAH